MEAHHRGYGDRERKMKTEEKKAETEIKKWREMTRDRQNKGNRPVYGKIFSTVTGEG